MSKSLSAQQRELDEFQFELEAREEYERDMRLDSKDIPDHIKRLMPKTEQPTPTVPLETQFELHAEQSEAKLQEDMEEMLCRFGAYELRSRMDRKTTTPVGTPDFVCGYRGKFLAVECKVKPNKLTKDQEDVRDDIIRAGCHYIVAYSTEDVRPWLIENEVKL